MAYVGATAAYGPDAVATDKIALRPGQSATQSHYTNYVRGLNRVVIDVADRNQWLQVTVLARGGTGVPIDDVFVFGNQVGEIDGALRGHSLRVDAKDQQRFSGT